MQSSPSSKRLAKRIVGLDFGMARIGVAISDEMQIIATPMATFKTEKKTELTVDKLLAELNAHAKAMNCELEAIVIGLPLLMSGKSGLLADEVKNFAEILKQRTSIPIILWDERLTTVQAEKSLRESSLSRKKRTAHVDSVAALIILQNYLDAKKF